MEHVLIVEDEQHIREFIAINLSRNHMSPFEAESGEAALRVLAGNAIDLVLLDLKLPGINGYEVCKAIREKYPNIGIIMVTAKNQDMDKIMGLELGADDYLTKPFNPQELIARIRSVVRRTKRMETIKVQAIVSGKIKIDYNSRKVFKEDVEIKLTPKEFDIIYTLAKDPGHTFTRDQLLDLIWGTDFYGDTKTLDVHIRRLREKIEEDAASPSYIETVWGIGYRWKDVK
ncbi:MAG: response regulator transcription factor [Clostridia bacterium]|nr:response regulator transcription factor [Clostridia bacterium]